MSDDNLNTTDSSLTVTTDQADYSPGEIAYFSATNATVGGSVEFSVAHVQAGADGIYGTADDLYTHDLAGTKSPWIVVDGSADDEDGILNGIVTTSWYVHQDALNQTFLLSAADTASGEAATASFTDSFINLTGGGTLNVTGEDGTGAALTAKVSTTVVTVGAGTGLISSFERLDASQLGTEFGFNTNYSKDQVYDNHGKGDANFIRALPLVEVPIQIIDGVAYRRFELDIHDNNTANSKLISLDTIQLWQSNNSSPTESDYTKTATPQLGTGSFGAGYRLVYNMDDPSAGIDNWIGLDGTLNSGSGNTVDMSLLIPASAFDTSYTYVFLASGFGYQPGTFNGSTWQAEATFEEWDVINPVGISGTKFNDLDTNGIKGVSEPGLSGWLIYIDANDNNVFDAGIDFSTTTDASGNWTFPSLAPGVYVIREEQQNGWTQSAPGGAENEFTVTLADVTSTGHDFGNYQNATKTGEKFLDANANGIKDAGEGGLSGWVIYDDANQNNAFDAGESAFTTGSDGNYTLTLKPGVHHIREVAQNGWLQSYPDIPGDGDWDVTLSSSQLDTGNDFGNYQNATKTGEKFLDANANGIKDAGEGGLSGWVIYDDANQNNAFDAGESAFTTGSDGNYTLSLKPGTHHIREVAQNGWVQSYPEIPGDGDWDISLTSGQLDSGNDFGNYQNGTKTGQKFLDANANGIKDAGEGGLSGWVIYDDANTNNAFDAGESAFTTGSDGNYTLSLKPGDHHIREVAQNGWIQSYPEIPGDGDWDISLTSGQLDSGNDFGNYQNATKTGQKFLDANANGIKDAGEGGLSGWVIYDDANTNNAFDAGESAFTTGSDGNYTLSLKPGDHHIREVAQNGWIQSYPEIPGDGDWDISLTSGQLDSGNDFGNYQGATKTGQKFLDANANGIKDAGEGGLSGWVIYDDANTNNAFDAGESAFTTGSDGNYTLTLKPGDHHIREVAQNGWIQSYPEIPGDGDWDISLTSGQLDSGNDFGNYQNATKTGEKFLDANANGIKDAGEGGLSGWVIYDDANTNNAFDAGESAFTTGSDGNYTLTLKPGDHHIREVAQNGWIQSYPEIPGDGDWDISLTSGQLDSGNDFGNYQNATKTGEKFLDANANGIKDAGEGGLSGWVIYDDANANNAFDAGESAFTTGSDGNYTLTLKPGDHHIREVAQNGWIQSYPEIPGDGDWDISLTSGQLDSANDFGNYQNATKTGTKFNDLNANGQRDAGEPGIQNWGIWAEGAGGTFHTFTDSNGDYSFSLKPGVYTITEDARAGWIQSYPDIPGDGDWDISLTSGQVDTGNDFGNYQNGTKTGQKFLDANANGIKDAGEGGLSGWVIYDDANTNNAFDAGESAFTTGSDGNYTLSLKPGDHHIREVAQNGWIQSYPEIPGDGDWDISLTSGQLDSGNDFGNYQNATKTGEKFLDANANGIKDAGEGGLSGWVIYDDANTNNAFDAGESAFTTGSDGNYTLSLKPGDHHIREVAQNGWIQSYPEIPGDGDWDISLTSGQLDSGNDFGNYQNATKTGEKFLDANANGIKDSGEGGLSGWVIYDDANANNAFDAGESAFTTGSDGNYTLSLKPGDHHIREVAQNGWIQSYPEIPGDGDWDISLTSGQLDSANDFGNYQNATKTGEKFHDLNANGVKDAGEGGLSGWVIYDDANANNAFDAGESAFTTGSDGNYTLTLKPGDHHIREVAQNGWIQSYPEIPGDGDWDITLTSGQLDTGNDFGNYLNGSIHGYKFLDSNGNGIIDNGEGPLSGVIIQLTGDVDGNGTEDTLFFTTGADGRFAFENLHPGDYTVQELFSDGTTDGATVDHNNDGIGDNTTQVTVLSGQELVPFQTDIAGIPGPQHGVLADNNGYDLIFGDIPLGGCGLSPGFWANHLYVWDGATSLGPKDGQGIYLADKLALAGTIEQSDILSLFSPALNVDGNDQNLAGQDIGPHNDIVIAGSGTFAGQFLVIEWDDAQQLISGTAIKGGDKLADFSRMLINAYLDDIGVPDFDAPAGLLSDAANWILSLNGSATTPWPTPAGSYHVLNYNNATEPGKDGLSATVKASSPAWTGSGAAIFNDLTAIICSDDPANTTGSNFQLSNDGSIVVLGIDQGDHVDIIDATWNTLGGYKLI